MATDLQEQLVAAVADLDRAETAAEVAAILRAEGITGKPGSCVSCPIALLVSKRLGGLPVRVEMGQIAAFTSAHTGASNAWVWQSTAVAQFIELFDRYTTPENLRDLVKEDWRG